MGIDLFGFVLIQGYEPIQDIIACRSIIRSTYAGLDR